MAANYQSRNSRPPTKEHKRKFTISDHALARFRERVDEEFRHRDDLDLGNLLDAKLRQAEFRYTVRDPRAPNEITQLYSVACRRATFYAVVREVTAVTVLDEQMAKNNFSGVWTNVLNAPFADALKDVKPAAPPPGRLGVAAPAATTPDPVEVAGIAYARALKHVQTCTAARARAATLLAEADMAVGEAKVALATAHVDLQAVTGEES